MKTFARTASRLALAVGLAAAVPAAACSPGYTGPAGGGAGVHADQDDG